MMRGPAWVYRLYDASGALLYIGSTRNPKARIGAHLSNGSKMYGAEEIRTRCTQHTVVEYATEAEAQRVERAAIYAESG